MIIFYPQFCTATSVRGFRLQIPLYQESPGIKITFLNSIHRVRRCLWITFKQGLIPSLRLLINFHFCRLKLSPKLSTVLHTRRFPDKCFDGFRPVCSAFYVTRASIHKFSWFLKNEPSLFHHYSTKAQKNALNCNSQSRTFMKISFTSYFVYLTFW